MTSSLEEPNRRPARSPRTGRGVQPSAKVKVFGSLLDGDKDDESLDDSFNLNENVRDEDENSELDSEDELELMNLTKNEPVPTARGPLSVAVAASLQAKEQSEAPPSERNGAEDSEDDF